MSKYEYKSMTRSEVERYLKVTGFNGEFIEEFMKMLKNPNINFLRIRGGKPSGVDGFITNDINYCIETNAKALCEWILITDSPTKLR